MDPFPENEDPVAGIETSLAIYFQKEFEELDKLITETGASDRNTAQQHNLHDLLKKSHPAHKGKEFELALVDGEKEDLHDRLRQWENRAEDYEAQIAQAQFDAHALAVTNETLQRENEALKFLVNTQGDYDLGSVASNESLATPTRLYPPTYIFGEQTSPRNCLLVSGTAEENEDTIYDTETDLVEIVGTAIDGDDGLSLDRLIEDSLVSSLSDDPDVREVSSFEVVFKLNEEKYALSTCIWACRVYATTSAVAVQERNEERVADLIMSGGCEAIISVLGKYASVQQIAHLACCTIRNICYARGENNDLKLFLGKNGVCEALLAVVSMHTGDGDVSEAAAGAIAMMARDCDYNMLKFRLLGAFDHLMQLACFGFNARHSQSGVVAATVCHALIALSATSPLLQNNTEAAKMIIDAGAPVLLVDFLRIHLHNKMVVATTLQTMISFLNLSTAVDGSHPQFSPSSSTGSVRARLGRDGCCEMVVEIMSVHKSLLVRRLACKALTLLAQCSMVNADRLVESGACEEVIALLQCYLMCRRRLEVLKQGSSLLSSSTSNSSCGKGEASSRCLHADSYNVRNDDEDENEDDDAVYQHPFDDSSTGTATNDETLGGLPDQLLLYTTLMKSRCAELCCHALSALLSYGSAGLRITHRMRAAGVLPLLYKLRAFIPMPMQQQNITLHTYSAAATTTDIDGVSDTETPMPVCNSEIRAVNVASRLIELLVIDPL